jgi:hypothetical protein
LLSSPLPFDRGELARGATRPPSDRSTAAARCVRCSTSGCSDAASATLNANRNAESAPMTAPVIADASWVQLCLVV